MELLPHEKQVVEYEKTIAEFKEKIKKFFIVLLRDTKIGKALR
ncbi:hypothetical protein B595_0437 [Chlamydia psittaci 84/55]|nr:hypothetical protein B595_0437 [Chlamydia psittaci 84/55]